jgi:hypothetical protein
MFGVRERKGYELSCRDDGKRKGDGTFTTSGGANVWC